MNEPYPMKPDWLKADKRVTGPEHRPRPGAGGKENWSYGMRCNILLPAPGNNVLYLDGNVYEILAPGTAVIRNDCENLIWRGLHQARHMDQPTGT